MSYSSYVSSYKKTGRLFGEQALMFFSNLNQDKSKELYVYPDSEISLEELTFDSLEFPG